MSTTKIADSKGRISLGSRFANRSVLIETIDENEVRIQLARVVPEREAWLLDHPAARESVAEGIQQAAAGHTTPGPDLDADLADFHDETDERGDE